MSKSSLEAAAEAAAKVNAMLIAKGKLKLSASQIKPKVCNNFPNITKTAGDLITAEVDINDVTLGARNLLTRSHTQDEICKLSGVSISTRGRYMTPEERQSMATPDCRPLYLNIQASNHDAIKIAVGRIQEIIDHHVQLSGLPKSPTVGVVTYPAVSTNGSFGIPSVATSHLPLGTHFVQEKVFVGLEHAPAAYPVREKILGPGGSFLQHIKTETGAYVNLRGKGSGFIEPTSGREAFEPLYIHITHPKSDGLEAAKALAVNLIETAHVEFAQWQQLHQQTVLQPLTSAVLPQAAPSVAYQNQVVVTPAVLPINPTALSAGNGIVTTGLQVPASVSTLITPISVVSSVPSVSLQGIPSPAVITYPTYVANTNQVITPANTVLTARPAVPVSIIGMLPNISAAATYTATHHRTPFPNQLSYTQTVGYPSISLPQQTSLNQPPVSTSSVMMMVPNTTNYAFSDDFPASVHKQADKTKLKFYSGTKCPQAVAEYKSSPCLQVSNINHQIELQSRRGSTKCTAGDPQLMPPPLVVSRNPEPEKKKLKGALGGLAVIYGSDDSDDDTPPSPTAKRK